MKRFVQSPSYVRVRAATGAVFAIFGVVLIIQGIRLSATAGFRTVTIFVMGAALIALGYLRMRDYLRFRSAR